MAPKRSNRDITPSSAATTQSSTTGTSVPATTSPAPAKTSKAEKAHQKQSFDQIARNIVTHYVDETPQRTKLIDAFMAFLVVVGALQFLYCVLAGNYVSFDWEMGLGW
jgi:oligosaccharyltransferase complex subunit epsilon